MQTGCELLAAEGQQRRGDRGRQTEHGNADRFSAAVRQADRFQQSARRKIIRKCGTGCSGNAESSSTPEETTAPAEEVTEPETEAETEAPTNAAFPEADLAVDAACCAGVTPEKHRAALETMASCQIEIR